MNALENHQEVFPRKSPQNNHLLIFLLLMFLPLISCTVTRTVSGTISGLNNDTLYISLEASDSMGYQTLEDTILMKSGHFAFDVEKGHFTTVKIIPAGGPANIRKSGMSGIYCSEFIELFVDKGEKVTVDAIYDGKVMQYSLKGTPLNEKYSGYRNSLFEHQRKRTEALREIGRLRSAGEPLIKGQKMLKTPMDSIRKITTGFIDDNLNSPLAPYVILMNFGPDYGILNAYKDKFTPEALKHPLTKEYLNYVKYAENFDKDRSNEKAFLELKGKQAPDFTLKTIGGKDFTLSSLKGKYVVLDFWGSWCGWCLEYMPDLLKYHKKYSHDIVVVTIACKDKDSEWRKAVSDLKMDGLINIFDANNVVAGLYYITEYPTQVLITPEGTVEPFVGNELYDRLDKLFGNKH